MSRLKVKQTYFTRCLYCENLNEYTARDINVNSNLTDDDIYFLTRKLGNIDSEWCDNCNKKTAQMEVAYSLEEFKGSNGGSDERN